MTEPAPLTENEIYERMVAAILDHRLPPGMKLVEDRLATAFGVSRTRVRPVLVRLANEQIVALTPNRGATVAQPTEREAREVFEVRRMIEPFLIEYFIAQAQPADISTLTHCIANEEEARLMREHLVQLESPLRFTPPPAETPDLVSLFSETGPIGRSPEFVAL